MILLLIDAESCSATTLDDLSYAVDDLTSEVASLGSEVADLRARLTSDLSDVSTSVVGLQSNIDSAIQAANAAVEAANEAVEAVNAVAATAGDAAHAAMDAADAAADAKDAAGGLTTLVYGAIGASLVAALAALSSLMKVSRSGSANTKLNDTSVRIEKLIDSIQDKGTSIGIMYSILERGVKDGVNSIEEISNRTAIDKDTIKRIITELDDMGFLLLSDDKIVDKKWLTSRLKEQL